LRHYGLEIIYFHYEYMGATITDQSSIAVRHLCSLVHSMVWGIDRFVSESARTEAKSGLDNWIQGKRDGIAWMKTESISANSFWFRPDPSPASENLKGKRKKKHVHRGENLKQKKYCCLFLSDREISQRKRITRGLEGWQEIIARGSMSNRLLHEREKERRVRLGVACEKERKEKALRGWLVIWFISTFTLFELKPMLFGLLLDFF